ncbi:MAG: tRNA lysidine(34) synthetase TilS [Clostridia bacterium]|nr:tRNA lysidine(34) synthetase TilS [Clostridia bacterium]
MICKVKSALEKYSMHPEGKRVVVALSGGADSMALLTVLYRLRDEYGLTLEACHVNHGIRGDAAKRDEDFVKSYCEKLGIKLHLFSYDVPAVAKKQGIGLEECGRRLRYKSFASLGDCLTATAHTLSDRCETLLLNEVRGSSVKGLCSIPAVRGNIIRPLIDCTRSEIEDYCRDNSIPFVTDDTNFDDLYSRNRIRLNVIPELRKLNPSLEQAFQRLINCASEDEEYFERLTAEIVSEAEKANGYDAELISRQHTSVRKRVIAHIIKTQTGLNPELIHLKMVEDILEGGTVQIIGDTVVKVKNSVLYINPQKETAEEWEYDFSTLEVSLKNRKIKATVFNKNDLPPKQFVHNKVLDYDTVVGGCVIRNRRAGDRLRLAGSSCTKTLKKIFNEKHLEGRNNLAVLADDEGILWVENLGCTDRAKITEKTVNVLLIEYITEV